MYAVKEVSREEWVFRGLAIAMILAMVGLTVMPAIVAPAHTDVGFAMMYFGMKYDRVNMARAGWLLFNIGMEYVWSPTAKIGLML